MHPYSALDAIEGDWGFLALGTRLCPTFEAVCRLSRRVCVCLLMSAATAICEDPLRGPPPGALTEQMCRCRHTGAACGGASEVVSLLLTVYRPIRPLSRRPRHVWPELIFVYFPINCTRGYLSQSVFLVPDLRLGVMSFDAYVECNVEPYQETRCGWVLNDISSVKWIISVTFFPTTLTTCMHAILKCFLKKRFNATFRLE